MVLNNHSKHRIIYSLLAMIIFLPMINYYIAAVLWSFDIKNPYAQYLYFLAYLAGIISWIKYPSTKKILVFIVVLFSLLLSIQLTKLNLKQARK